MSYQQTSFSAATVQRLAAHLAQLLGQMTDGGERCLGELSMLEYDEHQRLTHDWNPVDAPFEQTLCIHQRSEEHTSELQSLMRISYAVFCLKKKSITHIVLM